MQVAHAAFVGLQGVAAPGDTPVLFRAIDEAHLGAVLAIEQGSYGFPWSRRNFRDSLAAGYQMQCLARGEEILGYFVAMAGWCEVHLLNITVAADFRRQGWARVMLDALALWSRLRRADAIWLEVRAGNAGALRLYECYGFERVGWRRGYYPAGRSQREDAILMTLPLRAADPTVAAGPRRSPAERPTDQGAAP